MSHGGGGALAFGFSLALLAAIVGVIAGRRMPDESSIRLALADLPRAAMLPALVIGVLAAARFLEALVRLILGPESLRESIADLGGGGSGT